VEATESADRLAGCSGASGWPRVPILPRDEIHTQRALLLIAEPEVLPPGKAVSLTKEERFYVPERHFPEECRSSGPYAICRGSAPESDNCRMNRTTKLLLIENSTGHSGSAISLCNLVANLDREKFRPFVVFSRLEQLEYIRRNFDANRRGSFVASLRKTPRRQR
jgi:hypothetical protein